MENKPGRVPLEVEQPISSVPPSVPPPVVSGSAPTGVVDVNDIQEKIVAALRTCFDPEIPVNIYELGLIYNVDVQETGAVHIRMTLTSPGCPAAGSLPPEVQAKAQSVPGVHSVKVELVWDPPWGPDRMSEAAKVQLGLF
jgi:FeS assembly SUF system protein